MNKGQLAVIGLGKLGAPLAAVLAGHAGYKVVGADLNQNFVEAICEGRPPVAEPMLDTQIALAGSRLTATTDVGLAVRDADATFIIVPTPSTESGDFTNRYVLAALDSVGRALRDRPTYHLVVVTSTVMPGSMGGEIRKCLERSSGKRVGTNIGLCYKPEFIALGEVINGLIKPDFVLIGESDTRAGDALAAIRANMAPNAPIVRMNLVNAEITKLAINTFVTTKISYANMLADLCDRIPGADVDVVTSALGHDRRIGPKYLRGATGYGGPCFPRDNLAYSALARRLGARADLAEVTDAINRYQVERLFSLVRRIAASNSTVAILGLAYKPNTNVVEESQAIQLAILLHQAGYRVSIWDPVATPAASAVLRDRATAASAMLECVRNASVVVIMTPCTEFAALSAEAFTNQKHTVAIIDCWRVLPADSFAGVVDLVYPGTHVLAEGRLALEVAG